MANANSSIWNDDPAGRNFGPYTIVRRLGAGGMAETFEATRGGPGGFSQRVCLKLVLPFYRGREDFLAAFEREARLAAKLRHSNIVGVIDFGQIDGVSYMALELVDGVDLAALLDAQPNKRLSHEMVALLGYELAAGLEHAHDPHRDGLPDAPADTVIIHRDVSPSNVLISHRGEVMLTDFGVAKAITATAREQSAVKGKVPYMSPEHLRAAEIDGRADLFSLGVVLYEALAGRRPFQGGNDPATILAILAGQRPALHTLASDAPPELCEVIEALLEPDANKRLGNASEVRDRLHAFLPPPSKRRELGQMASITRVSLPPFTPARAGSGVNITGATSDPSGPGAPTEAQRKGAVRRTPSQPTDDAPRSRRAGLWALGIAIAIAAAGVWFVGQRQAGVDDDATRSEGTSAAVEAAEVAPTGEAIDPPDGRANPTAAVPSVAEVDAAAAPEEASERVADNPDAKPKPAAAAPARLSVYVFPWGQVWIDGKVRGSAPLEGISLKPGRHKVSAGRGKPSKTQTVRLRAGQRKSLTFDLTENGKSND
ncbi:MAG: serine/threonine-protein kinase [Myxococcota bacterium]